MTPGSEPGNGSSNLSKGTKYMEKLPEHELPEEDRKCPKCGKLFEKESPYTYRPACEHFPKDIFFSHL